MGFIVVTYDITCDRRRARLRKKLKGFGEPIQYSVFECNLKAKQKQAMITVIKGIIKQKEDRVRIYEMCGGCSGKTFIFGKGKMTEDSLSLFV
jgi:CRISPR-associated protein Cas2|tara:strand:- start:215 stop:493 length:279 start_codon:yes stop_codon:yes gene_type:complete